MVFREVNAWRFFGRVWIDWTHTELHAFDPQEEDPKLAPQFLEADVIAMGFARARGNCHHSWELRAEILKERYGIRWRSPREMNPDTMFD